MDEEFGGVSEVENDFIKRMRSLRNYFAQTYPVKEDGREQGFSSHYSPGDFRYVSPPAQNHGSSGIALERFVRDGNHNQ